MTFLITIGLWLLKIASNPLVQAVVKSVFMDLFNVGKDYLPTAIEAVKTAATRTDLDATGKFELAASLIKESFPDIPHALLNSIIENVYGMLKKEPDGGVIAKNWPQSH